MTTLLNVEQVIQRKMKWSSFFGCLLWISACVDETWTKKRKGNTKSRICWLFGGQLRYLAAFSTVSSFLLIYNNHNNNKTNLLMNDSNIGHNLNTERRDCSVHSCIFRIILHYWVIRVAVWVFFFFFFLLSSLFLASVPKVIHTPERNGTDGKKEFGRAHTKRNEIHTSRQKHGPGFDWASLHLGHKRWNEMKISIGSFIMRTKRKIFGCISTIKQFFFLSSFWSTVVMGLHFTKVTADLNQ